MNGSRLTTYLLLREDVVACCEARSVVHERPGGQGAAPVDIDSCGLKGAKGRGSKGG